MPAAATTHYDTLGVAPGAPPEEVRRAYLDLARRLHPDRVAEGGDRAEADTRIREVNEAWRVLGDPERRRRYDTDLVRRTASSVARTKASAMAPTASGRLTGDLFVDERHVDTRSGLVRALPWLAVVALLGAIFVFTAYASGGPVDDEIAGSCVVVADDSSVETAACADPGARLVRNVVSSVTGCPPGTEPFQPSDRDVALCFGP